VADSAAPERWAQFSYASFDTGSGGGGWQVKESTGGLTGGERESLLPGVVTSFDSHMALPRFPTASDVATAPRRFSYIRTASGPGIYWHAVQAGSDSTGRPGNVFSHVTIDRCPGVPEPELRPIEMWRSPDLLAPFGSDEVVAASFGSEQFPRFGVLVGSDSNQSFLFDSPTWRVGVLCVLLDSIAEALAGGRRVVLVTDTVDSAAGWIDAVSRLTSPEVTRRLSFSLYERAGSLESAWAKGVLIAAVPSADIHDLGSADVIVIAESETPVLGSLGGPDHCTAAGSKVVVTEWSEMAQIALIDPEIARDSMQRVDAISRRVGDSGLAVDWPLAMAVAEAGKDLEDALPAARRVILRSSPTGIRDDPALFRIATEVTGAEAGVTAADAWVALEQVQPERSPITYELMRSTYLQRALQDSDWVTQPGSVPMPAGGGISAEPALGAVADSVLRRALDLDRNLPDDAVFQLRLVNLMLASGILDPFNVGSTPSYEIAVELLAGSAASFLRDPHTGAGVVARVGDTTQALRSIVLREAIESTWPDLARRPTGPGQWGPGQRYAPEVIAWLCAGLPTEELLARADSTGTLAPLDLEFAIARLESLHVDGLSSATARGMLEWFGSWERVPEKTLTMLVNASWSAAEATSVELVAPGQLPAIVLARVLVQERWDESLRMLVARLAGRPAGSHEQVLATFRLACADAREGRTRLAPDATFVGRIVDLIAHFGRPAWDDIAPYFLALMLSAALQRPRAEGLPTVATTLVGSAAAADSMAESGAIAFELWRQNGADLVAAGCLGLITAPDYPLPLASALSHSLRGVVLRSPGGLIPLTEIVIRYAVDSGSYPSIDSAPELLNSSIAAHLNVMTDAKKRERAQSESERFARGWWRSVGVGASRLDSARQTILGALRSRDDKEN
jgi:hypothetical protein